jgi:hypothetical protein
VRRSNRILPAALAAALTLTPGASASPTQESFAMDDPQVVFGTPAQVESTMATFASLGVDRVRVSVLWGVVAPASTSRERPSFDAANPAAYPAGAWDRYDRVVAAAHRQGLALHFDVTGPGPVWASSEPFRDDGRYEPSPTEFGDFVTAVGRRYPDIDLWSAWNEPNQPGWLRPQATAGVPASPRLYRALQDAAFSALRASGHGADTYLLAETAPRGSSRLRETSPMRPLLFVRELYCLDRELRPYGGERAAARGCPTDSAGRRRFVADHPGLFQASGFAHHPYALEAAPSTPDPARDQVTLGVLGRLTSTLDRIFRRYGVSRRLPLWLTEYGYQTDPPDPIVGVSWRSQSAYLNEAEYLTYRNPRVRALTQFLLVDDAPNENVQPDDPRYWGSTFQSGLIMGDGRPKDAFLAYQRTIHVTRRRVRRGRAVRVFGQLRPAPAGAALEALVELRRRGTARWRVLRRVTTRNARNYLLVRVRPPVSGALRLAWRDPAGGRRLRSRSVAVSVVRR